MTISLEEQARSVSAARRAAAAAVVHVCRAGLPGDEIDPDAKAGRRCPSGKRQYRISHNPAAANPLTPLVLLADDETHAISLFVQRRFAVDQQDRTIGYRFYSTLLSVPEDLPPAKAA